MKSVLILLQIFSLFNLSDSLSRQRLHEELIKLEADQLAKWEKMTPKARDVATRYESRHSYEDGVPLVISRQWIPRVKVEDF